MWQNPQNRPARDSKSLHSMILAPPRHSALPIQLCAAESMQADSGCSDSGKGAWGPNLFSIPQLKVIVVSFSIWQRSLSICVYREVESVAHGINICVCVCVCERERERERASYKQWYVRLDEVIVWWHHVASLKLAKEGITYHRNWKTTIQGFLKKKKKDLFTCLFFHSLLLDILSTDHSP